MSTIQLLKDNLAGKDDEILRMKGTHDSAIASLHEKVTVLQNEVGKLREANVILQGSLTGKQAWTDIYEILKPVGLFFAADGMLAEIRENQQRTLKDLSEIRASLELTPSIVTPPHSEFVPRA